MPYLSAAETSPLKFYTTYSSNNITPSLVIRGVVLKRIGGTPKTRLRQRF